jgi:hypothetical protein
MRSQMLALLISLTVWIGCIGAASVLGAWLSFYTGERSELPKWNGWEYLWFSVNEFAVMGSIFGIPIAILAFCIAWLVVNGKSRPRNTATGNDGSSVSSERSLNS